MTDRAMTENLDLETFQDRLGRELVTAAARRSAASTAKRGPTRLPTPWPAALTMAAAVIAVALIGAVALRPQPAVADVFVITRAGGAIRLDVVDIVTEPGRVEQQLATEAGLDAELDAVPAAPELVGHFLRAEFESAVRPEVGFEGGSIATVTLPPGFSGRVRLVYGRAAEPGETYTATVTDPSCAGLWASTAGESLELTAELGSTVRYETIDPDNQRDVDVAPTAIDPTYKLVDITSVSETEVVVTYAADLDAIPRDRNCR